MNPNFYCEATRHALRATVLAVLCAAPLAQAAASFYATEQKSLKDVQGGPYYGSSTVVTEANGRTYRPARRFALHVTRAKTTQNSEWHGEDGTTYPPVIDNFDQTYAATTFPASMAMAATGTSSGVSAAGVLQVRAIDEYNFGPGSIDSHRLNSSAQAGFSDDWVFQADASHAAGTTGSFITWINLSGQIDLGTPLTADLFHPDRLASAAFWANGTVATATASWRDGVQSVGAVVTTPFVYGRPFAVSFNLSSAGGPEIADGYGYTYSTESFTARIAYIRTPTGSVLQHHLSTLPIFRGTGVSLATAAASREFAAMNMAAPVPEPGTWALMIAGLAGVAGVSKRRVAAKA